MFMIRRQILKPNSVTRFLGTLVEPKEIKVPVPWGHVAVKQWGERSQPIVICCHGYLDNAGSFDKLIPLLPQKYCYLAMDFPGHGFSSPSYDGLFYTDELYIESMNRVQRYFGNEKVGMIGHSMGSAIITKYNYGYLGALSFFVTMELPCFPKNPMEERIRHAGRRMDKIIRQFSAKDREPARTMEELLRGLVIGWGGSVDREAATVLLKRGAKPVEDKWKLSRHPPCGNNQVFSINSDIFFTFKNPAQFSDVSVCTIEYLEGIRFNTTELLERNLKVYSEIFKRVEYHALPGKHHLLLTNPKIVAKVITEFMDRVEHQ